MSDIVIVGAKRTAIGSFLGQFSGVPTPTSAPPRSRPRWNMAASPPATWTKSSWAACCRPISARHPARQAALAAGLSPATGCTTINKVCGSGMKAIMQAHDAIKAGTSTVVVAGGMESMTNAPHLIPNSRSGNRYGNFEAVDHMAWDGLTNPYDGKAMGVFGEQCADKYALHARGTGCLCRRNR